jgi:chromate reductase, NAD(P)H dehydrogenase (quinone)
VAEFPGRARPHPGSGLHLVGFAGSLRRGSYNRALLAAAQEVLPADVTLQVIEIGQLPFYNADVEKAGDPPSVAEFKSLLQPADGLLIATPEYNGGIPGVLTNAIDWASRLPGRAPITGKPVAVMGASPSQIGTARAQLHLRQILGHLHCRILPPPELLVAKAHEKFDAKHRLTHEGTRAVLTTLLERFAGWIRREQAAERAAAGAGAGAGAGS